MLTIGLLASKHTVMKAEKIINDILRREGGFVDHPDDRGGPTKYGVTQKTLAEWRGRQVTADDVRNLTEAEARRIYLDMYVRRPGFCRIEDEALRALVVDSAVNHGPRQAARWLQQAAGVLDDGIVGPVTLAAVNAGDAKQLYRKVLAKRCRFYGRIVTHDHTQAAFAAGWASRIAEFIEGTP